MNERFNELLPWYVNGTLDAADREWMQQHLAEHPEARAELEWYASLQNQVRKAAPEVSASIGLAKTLHLIRGDRPTLTERINGWFAGFGMRPAMALAGVAVMAVQGAVILQLLDSGRDEGVELRAVPVNVAPSGALLKIQFTPDAKEVDVRLLLVSVEASLAGGPGLEGDYYIRVPADRAGESVAKLQARTSVKSVVAVPDLPASLHRP